MQTALRELEEETGITQERISVKPSFKKEVSHSYIAKNGQRLHKNTVYFCAHSPEDSITLSPEHNAWEWASIPQITTYIIYNKLRHLILESING